MVKLITFSQKQICFHVNPGIIVNNSIACHKEIKNLTSLST